MCKVDTLPGTEHEFPALEGNTERGCRQCGLNVRGHVVRAFQRVRKQRIVFRDQSVQPVFQVNPGTVVVVFLYQQAGRRVTKEQGAQTFCIPGIGYQRCHRGCDRVKALAFDVDG